MRSSAGTLRRPWPTPSAGSQGQSYLSQDDEESYANQLYNLAVCNPDKVDDARLVQAEKEAKKGLLMAIHPRDQLYEVLILIYQQQNDFVRLARYLELLAKLKPRTARPTGRS